MSRKVLTWTMLGMLVILVILPLYMRGIFNSSLSDVYEAAPASKAIQHEQRSRLAPRVDSAFRVPIPQLIDPMSIWNKIEKVNVEPSGAVPGQVLEEEGLPLLDIEEATGPFSAITEAESIEHVETLEAEKVNVEPSGAVPGQVLEEEGLPLDPEALEVATGTVSQ